MSDIEQDKDQRPIQEEGDENAKNPVPIISDKEIEAIFVGGVPSEADESYLQQCFEKYGEIKQVKIINSVKTKKPKRFAIVTFSHPVASSILVQDHWIMGRKVDVKEYLSGEEANNKLTREKQRKVFVGGLPLTVNNEILKGYFQNFGKVIEANIVYNHETMRSRGFGFVIFQDEKTVQEVLKRYDDHYLYGKWIECKPALLKEEVPATEIQTQPGMSPQTAQSYPSNPIGATRPMRSQMPTTAGGMPDMKGSPQNPQMAMKPQRVPVPAQANSQDSDNQESNQQTNSKMTPQMAGKKKPVQGGPEGHLQAGSEDGSQSGSKNLPQNQRKPPPQMYDYSQYGLQQHGQYQYPGYNYQAPHHHSLGGQGYGMYPPTGYSPMMNQRPPMKQYGYPGYNYQDRGYGGPTMGMKGMQHAPEYYDEYNYAEPDMPAMRGGRMDNQHGYQPARQPKGQKQMMGDRPLGQYPGYQYGNQHMGPMYQPVPHPVHYDVRNHYEYAPYKGKAGDSGMPPVQSPAYYNYGKPMNMPPYNYSGGHYGNQVQLDQEEEEEDNGLPRQQQQMYREDQMGAGQKNKKAPARQPKPADEAGSKDLKPVKVGKAKQFAEDLDANNMDN